MGSGEIAQDGVPPPAGLMDLKPRQLACVRGFYATIMTRTAALLCRIPQNGCSIFLLVRTAITTASWTKRSYRSYGLPEFVVPGVLLTPDLLATASTVDPAGETNGLNHRAFGSVKLIPCVSVGSRHARVFHGIEHRCQALSITKRTRALSWCPVCNRFETVFLLDPSVLMVVC